MRLLDTNTGHFVEKDPKRTKYAILSHTWDESGEQTYKELRNIQKRYDPHRGFQSSVISPYVPQALPHSPTSLMTPTPPMTSANESTRLLPPRQLSLLEQGIPQSSKGHSESRFTHLKRRICHFLRPSWEFLVLLLALILPRHWIHDVSSSQVHNSGSPASTSFFDTLSDPIEPTPSRSFWDDPELSPKIRRACAVARANSYEYIWIDSCCIDKSSSSELSEAINSMYTWYGGAHVCYAYLADVPAGESHRERSSWFRKSRWFKRGWTLQELLAPLHLVFLSQDWAVIGPKYALVDIVQEITGISDEALLHVTSLDQFSVAQRLSWASKRVTTRVEDLAYSLLGIFDINMPTLYGEGERALRRLQERILQRIPDQSIFAWGQVYLGPPILPEPDTTTAKPIPLGHLCSPRFPQFLLSPMLLSFVGCSSVSTVAHGIFDHVHLEYTPSPYGIRTQFHVIPLSQYLPTDSIRYQRDEMVHWRWYLAILACEHVQRPGHLLGRVCYIPPSNSGVGFLSPGCVYVLSMRRYSPSDMMYDLFPLSPETIERCRPHLELLTVYISHPDRPNTPMQPIRTQPHHTITLLLLTNSRNALRAQGFTADLRSPSPTSNHPPTHWLLFHGHGSCITIAFQHFLDAGGKELLISASVPLRSICPKHIAQGDSLTADPKQVSWTDSFPWRTSLERSQKLVMLTGTKMLTMDLGLKFVCIGAYLLRVDVRVDDLPPDLSPSSVEPIQGEEGPCASDSEANERVRDVEEAGGHRSAVDAKDTPAADANGVVRGSDGRSVLKEGAEDTE